LVVVKDSTAFDFSCFLRYFTERISLEGKASVASVCPSVCFHSIFWNDWPLNLSLLRGTHTSTHIYTQTQVQTSVWVMNVARLGLKVNVIGQGQRLLSSAFGPGNAVTRSVW